MYIEKIIITKIRITVFGKKFSKNSAKFVRVFFLVLVREETSENFFNLKAEPGPRILPKNNGEKSVKSVKIIFLHR